MSDRPDIHQAVANDQATTFKRLHAEITRMQWENEQWRTWGIIEIAVRNPNVSSYMDHWEGRAEAAERANAALRAHVHARQILLLLLLHPSPETGRMQNAKCKTFRREWTRKLMPDHSLTAPLQWGNPTAGASDGKRLIRVFPRRTKATPTDHLCCVTHLGLTMRAEVLAFSDPPSSQRSEP